jgi:hypothetical protein
MESHIIENGRVTELLDQTKLNWKVGIEKIQTESGIILEDKIALVRDDNQAILGVHSNGYVPYQNFELLELLDKVSRQTGLPIHTGGSFGDGKKVFIQLKSNDLKISNTNGVPDEVKGFITGINSFDGSTSLSFGPSNRTISCQNTFWGAYRTLDAKIRHTKNMVMKIDDICKGIDGVVQEEKEIFNSIIQLSETSFDDIIRDRVIKDLFDIGKTVDLKDQDALSTVTRNKLSRFYIDLNGELKEKGENLWGLFSGVTKYTTHSITKGDNSENKMFGTYGKREREIFKDLVELV